MVRYTIVTILQDAHPTSCFTLDSAFTETNEFSYSLAVTENYADSIYQLRHQLKPVDPLS